MEGTDEGTRLLEQAFDQLESEFPDRLSSFVRWLRDPKSRLFRIPLGILFIIGGFLWFLPILGLWMLPLGLMLIAQDVPFLRKPIARATLWGVAQWRARRERWRRPARDTTA